MAIWLDLDGTLIDVRSRYCAAYAEVASELSLPLMNPVEYWKHRCAGYGVRAALAVTGSESVFELFAERHSSLIESEQYLRHDFLLDGVEDALTGLGENHALRLLTGRASRRDLEAQLAWLSIDVRLEAVYSVSPYDGRNAKAAVLTNHGRPGDLMVGDTPSDVLAGRDAGILSCGVFGGMSTEERLREAEPSYLVTSLQDVALIMQHLDE